MPKHKSGPPGTRRTTIQASRFLAARAAEAGGVAPLARETKFADQTVQRAIDRGWLRDWNARAIHALLRCLGFTGPTGLEPISITMVPVDVVDPNAPNDPTPPRAA